MLFTVINKYFIVLNFILNEPITSPLIIQYNVHLFQIGQQNNFMLNKPVFVNLFLR